MTVRLCEEVQVAQVRLDERVAHIVKELEYSRCDFCNGAADLAKRRVPFFNYIKYCHYFYL